MYGMVVDSRRPADRGHHTIHGSENMYNEIKRRTNIRYLVETNTRTWQRVTIQCNSST